jgi:hypothetical protein
MSIKYRVRPPGVARYAARVSAITYGFLRIRKLVKTQRQRIIFALDQYASATTQLKNNRGTVWKSCTARRERSDLHSCC